MSRKMNNNNYFLHLKVFSESSFSVFYYERDTEIHKSTSNMLYFQKTLPFIRRLLLCISTGQDSENTIVLSQYLLRIYLKLSVFKNKVQHCKFTVKVTQYIFFFIFSPSRYYISCQTRTWYIIVYQQFLDFCWSLHRFIIVEFFVGNLSKSYSFFFTHISYLG